MASVTVAGMPRLSELPPSLARISRLFDDRFRLLGTDFRFGLDLLVGLVPVVGDLLMLGVSLFIVIRAAVAGVSRRTTLLMLGNVLVDAVLGAIPVVGVVLDARFRAHARNLDLVRRDLARVTLARARMASCLIDRAAVRHVVTPAPVLARAS